MPAGQDVLAVMNTTYLTPAQAAAMMGTSVDTVRRRCIRGEIAAVKIGRDWRIVPTVAGGQDATVTTLPVLAVVDGNADDARLVFDVTAPTRQVDALQAQVDAQAVALSETVADRDTIATDRDALRVMVSSVTTERDAMFTSLHTTITERDALQAQVTILAMRVDALTLMRDQTAQEHERTVDALQSLVASQRETIDGQTVTVASQSTTIVDLRAEIIRLQAVDASRDAVLVDLSQRVRWWPSVLRAFGLVS